MAINYTPLLSLAEPVSGTQSGSWGNDINQGLTDYLDIAVAGAQVISGSQTAVTLSKTTGSAAATNIAQVGSAGTTGTAQYAVINCTGNPASMLTITAPTTSKTYVVINATSTNQPVKLVGAGPTTGVTVAAAQAALIAWNGSDFALIATTDASKLTGILSVANGGTGQSTAQAAINALAGAVTSGSYLRGNGTNVAMSTIQAADLPTATDSANGAIKLGSGTTQSVAANTVTATASRSYALQLNGSGQGIVNVPWTDTVYTLPAATSTVRGGIELGSDTVQSVAANSVTATASRTYALQVNADGQGVVNVPWTATPGTTPGGSTTQVQYNNAGAFGGSADFVFDGTNVGIGASTPSTYGKFVVGGTGAFTSSLVSTSSTLSDKPTFEFRKTSNVTSGQLNTLGNIAFIGKFGSTPGEQAFITATSQNVGGLADSNIMTLGVRTIGGLGAMGANIEISNTAIYLESTNGADLSIVNGVLSYNGSNHLFTGDANFADALTVANVPVVTTTGSQTLTNKTLTSPTMTAPVLGTPASGNFSTGTFTWPTFNQSTSGNALTATTATTATNIAAGTAGRIPYQTGVGTTGFTSVGLAGTVLQSVGSSAPVWIQKESTNTANAIVSRDASGNFAAGTITATLSGTATTATNIAAGAAGQLPYQTGAGTTAFVPVGANGYLLQSLGSSAPSWVQKTSANTANTVVNRDASGDFAANAITVTTPTAGDNSTKVATTAFVQTAIGSTGATGTRGQAFTANGTFTIPTGVTALKITVVGGGGGSGGGGTGGCCASFIGGSGAGGGAAIKYLTGLTPGNTLAVTVGGAGSAGAVATSGGTGGTSQVASGTQSITTVSATGGGGAPVSATGAVGGIGSNGDLNIGGQGGSGLSLTISFGGNQGGSSIFGGGAGSPAAGSVGVAGRAYGGGASGGVVGAAGGAGAAGAVIFEW